MHKNENKKIKSPAKIKLRIKNSVLTTPENLQISTEDLETKIEEKMGKKFVTIPETTTINYKRFITRFLS